MTELYKECEGCGPTHLICILKPKYIDDQGNKIVCPCTTCLVKGICNKSCNDKKIYFKSHPIMAHVIQNMMISCKETYE